MSSSYREGVRKIIDYLVELIKYMERYFGLVWIQKVVVKLNNFLLTKKKLQLNKTTFYWYTRSWSNKTTFFATYQVLPYAHAYYKKTAVKYLEKSKAYNSVKSVFFSRALPNLATLQHWLLMSILKLNVLN